MDKMQFLGQLDAHLSKLPFEERQNALRYYMEYFDEAGVENEQQILMELGNPRDVAAQILADSAVKNLETTSQTGGNTAKSIWTVILAIFAAPIALPIAAAIVAVLVALFVSLFAFIIVGFACVFGGFVAGIAGITVIMESPITTVFFCGAGLFLIGFGILWSIGSVALIRAFSLMLARIFTKIKTKREHKKTVAQAQQKGV